MFFLSEQKVKDLSLYFLFAFRCLTSLPKQKLLRYREAVAIAQTIIPFGAVLFPHSHFPAFIKLRKQIIALTANEKID